MRQMDCLHECYSFTLYAPVTLEELMSCKFANQIASVISKHSSWFIRIINTVQRKCLWIQGIMLWSTKEICAAPYLWLDLVRWHTAFGQWMQIYPIWHWIWGLVPGVEALITGAVTWSYSTSAACPGQRQWLFQWPFLSCLSPPGVCYALSVKRSKTSLLHPAWYIGYLKSPPEKTSKVHLSVLSDLMTMN